MHIYYFLPRLLQTLIWIPAHFGLKFFVRLRVEGVENLKGLSRGVIFASNHASEMDPIMIPAAMHPFSKFFPMYYVARKKGFYDSGVIKPLIYGGVFFHIWGAYPAYSGHHDYEQSLMHHIQILNKKHNIHIFPEGGKSKDGKMKDEARGGVAFLAWRTGRPVVPLAIKGTYGTTVKKFLLRKKRYTLVFGKPLYPKDLFPNGAEPTIDEIKNAAQEVLATIKSLSQ